MSGILLEFAESGGLMAVLLLFFMIGFALKIIANLFYDNAIEEMNGITLEKKGIVSDIITRYDMNLKQGNKIRNTQAFVNNEMHQWKKYGVRVERMEPLGDLFGGFCVIFCAFFDMLMLTQKAAGNNGSEGIIRYVYVYTAISVIFFLVLKLWSIVTDSNNKRKILTDGLTNYMDNQLDNLPEYVMPNSILPDENEAQNNIKPDATAENVNAEKNGNEESTPSAQSEDGKEEMLKKEDKELVISQVLDEFLV